MTLQGSDICTVGLKSEWGFATQLNDKCRPRQQNRARPEGAVDFHGVVSQNEHAPVPGGCGVQGEGSAAWGHGHLGPVVCSFWAEA